MMEHICKTKKDLTNTDNIKYLIDELRNDLFVMDSILIQSISEGKSNLFKGFSSDEANDDERVL